MKDLTVEEARGRLVAFVQRYFIDVAQHKVLLIHAALDHNDTSNGTQNVVIQKSSLKASANVSGGASQGTVETTAMTVEESSASMVVEAGSNGTRSSGSVTTVLRDIKEVHGLGTIVVQNR